MNEQELDQTIVALSYNLAVFIARQYVKLWLVDEEKAIAYLKGRTESWNEAQRATMDKIIQDVRRGKL